MDKTGTEEVLLQKLKKTEQQLHDYIIALGLTNHSFRKLYLKEKTLVLSEFEAEIYGFSGTEIKNMPETFIDKNIIREEDVEGYKAFYEALFNGESYAVWTGRLLSVVGKEVWLQLAYAASTEEGDAEYAVGVSYDITDLMQNLERQTKDSHFFELTVQDYEFFVKYDLEKDILVSLEVPPNMQDFFAQEEKTPKEIDALLRELILPEDFPQMEFLLSSVKDAYYKGGDYHNFAVECRFKSLLGRFDGYHWGNIHTAKTAEGSLDSEHVYIFIQDVHVRKLEELHIRESSQRDPLTGLFNRAAFEELFAIAVRKMENTGGMSAFFILDIDDFKFVNDTFGHQRGDYVLSEIAAKIKGVFRSDDMVARFGGDEYVVYMHNIPSREVAALKGEEICNLVKGVRINEEEGGDPLFSSCSVGISLFPHHGKNLEQLYEAADKALYVVKKELGKGVPFLYKENRNL